MLIQRPLIVDKSARDLAIRTRSAMECDRAVTNGNTFNQNLNDKTIRFEYKDL